MYILKCDYVRCLLFRLAIFSAIHLKARDGRGCDRNQLNFPTKNVYNKLAHGLKLFWDQLYVPAVKGDGCPSYNPISVHIYISCPCCLVLLCVRYLYLLLLSLCSPCHVECVKFEFKRVVHFGMSSVQEKKKYIRRINFIVIIVAVLLAFLLLLLFISNIFKYVCVFYSLSRWCDASTFCFVFGSRQHKSFTLCLFLSYWSFVKQ